MFINQTPRHRRIFWLSILVFSLFSVGGLASNSSFSSAPYATPPADVEAAIKEAEKAIESAKQTTAKVEEAKSKIVEANKNQKAEDITWKVLAELTKYLKANVEKTLKDHKDGVTALTTQKAALEKIRKELEGLKEKPEGTDTQIANLKKKEGELDAQIKTGNDATADLEKETRKLYNNVDTIAKSIGTSLAPLADDKLAANAKADALLSALPTQLPVFGAAVANVKEIEKTWPLLAAESKKITAVTPDPGPAIVKSKADTAAVEAKLSKWFETVKKQSEETNKSLVNKRLELDKDLQANAVTAIKLLDEAEQEQELLADFVAAWQVLASQIKNSANFAALKSEFDAIEKAWKLRPDHTQLVREALAGDFEKFVPDFVQLYYFSDAFSLMKALNLNVKEVRDVSALRDEAAKQQRLLLETTLAKDSLVAEVSALQTRARDLEDELNQAENNAASTANLLIGATRRLDELKGRPEPDQGKIRAAEQRKADLETEDKANQDTLTKLSDEKAGLPAKIAETRKALVEAQKAVRERANAMVVLANVESEAFARARDNEPIFYTDINVTSKDPVKQIQIFAFGSRRVIYLRGRKENVEKAKDIISLFDRPAPQARLNLWTLELNSTADIAGSKKFNKALSRVENELTNTRAKITATLSFLRDCINEEVNAIAIEKLRELEQARITHGDQPDNGQMHVAPQDAEDLRWARMYFYQKEVLMRLGFDAEKSVYESRRQANIVNFRALPDPAGTTTLGESLVILSLANAASRHEILKKFSTYVESKLIQLGLYQTREDQICLEQPAPSTWFASTLRALNADDQPYYKYQQLTEPQLRRGGRPDPQGTPPIVPTPRFFPHDYAFTPMQQRIVEAISMAQIPRLISRLRQLQQRLLTAGRAEQDRIQAEARAILSWLRFTLGVNVNDVLTPGRVTELEVIARKNNILRTANAKVASTDLMLRQMINEVDSDISVLFVQPMVDCLRRRLVSEGGISVGVVNYTSVLATNRLVARVDARASAQLSVGEETDIVAGLQQLTSLYLGMQTGNVLGGIAALRGLPQKQTSEVYGINNGSLFKVTPIFDPTGQALRFQFDYVLANLVRDPDNSITPQLPRIERHTVNTEVELNNLELREISRFSSNSRLGIPTTKKGGIPIIKDIPGMDRVPLFGWFVRRSGKAAVIQQSLMFGQTTMHPTIADIFDLLSGEDYSLGNADCRCNGTEETVVAQPVPIPPKPDNQDPAPEPKPDDPGAGPTPPDTPNPPATQPNPNPGRQQPQRPEPRSREIQTLQARIIALQNEIETLETKASKSDKEKREKDERIDELTREVAKLRAELARLGVRTPLPLKPDNPGLIPDTNNSPPRIRGSRIQRRRSQGRPQQQR